MPLSQSNQEIASMFVKMTDLIKALRAEHGCPWDRKQTLKSFHPYVLEEYHELAHAITISDMDEVVEELGDLIFLVTFLCCMVQESGASSVDKILARVVDKMIRRHPHVFGDISVADDKEVIANWTRIKASEEKIKRRKSVLDGIPRSLPALNRAQKISSRASRVGFDWVDLKDILPKVDEEIHEFKEALETNQIEKIRDELGDILFVMVNVGRKLGINSESCLNETTDKFEDRFKHIERRLAEKGKTWSQTTLDEMERYWNEAKELKRDNLKKNAL